MGKNLCRNVDSSVHLYYSGDLTRYDLKRMHEERVRHYSVSIMAGRFFCFALVIFSYVGVFPALGYISHIYEDHTISFENKTLEINHTVYVHQSATLTIQPGVNIIFTGNGSLIVHGNFVANGSDTLPIDISSETEYSSDVSTTVHPFLPDLSILRLVGGNGFSTGRLELYHNGIWGTVCDDGWSQTNSIVACRQLGFTMGTFTREFPGGLGQIWLDDVRCSEGDLSLTLCSHRGFGIHNCGRCTGHYRVLLDVHQNYLGIL